MFDEKSFRPLIISRDNKTITYICVNCGAIKTVRLSIWKRGKSRFCSTGCGTSWRNKHKNPMKNNETREKVSKTLKELRQEENQEIKMDFKREYRKIAFDNLPHKCALCGYDKNYNSLEVHHKDRNRENNDISNLMILCSHCHQSVVHSSKWLDLGKNFELHYRRTTTMKEEEELEIFINLLDKLMIDLKNPNSDAYKKFIGKSD